ncbi:hypothetical protein [Streptomyces pactum]|uniref:PASTA domain-containing protein n=1 Tax=Streptomyces pactum TaxID=68249 RepID=A0A1S6JAU4_9ACTN|nr:hypothetical protein [Streptomyces pactum]AQS68853.1 hypothetical protein B1H29_19730 [Streptomyces pactum]
MTVTKLLLPASAAVLLASVTACGASSVPQASPSASAGSATAGTRPSANVQPVTATVPDVIGGNAGRAYEQMSSELDMTFEDASGQGRRVDDPAEWKICDSRPGPNQQITDAPVVFGVVRVSEKCRDTTPE